MTNIELYINEKLCDILNPENLGVRLNRVLMNPAELSSKDAQYSYSITIPSSPANDAIFNYTNVEEVKNKFNHHRTAQLYVDSVKVFDGLFKLSEISEEGNYKGNLVLPAIKTVKELFGDKKMSDIGFWKLDLKKPDDPSQPMGIAEAISLYNKMEGTPDCIFPMVLYGLLPKVAMDEEGNYSGKKEWDKYVRLGVEDFPPSINCLKAIKKIFANAVDDKGRPLEITGTAFDDSRLTNLYMSYQNAVDYEQPWNWGHLGQLKVKGEWHNAIGAGVITDFETQFYTTETTNEYQSEQDEQIVINKTETGHVAVNLFSSRNATIDVLEDVGYNVNQYTTKQNKAVIKNTSIRVPVSGLYKVTFEGSIELFGSNTRKDTSNRNLGIRFAYANENDKKTAIKDEGYVSRNLFHDIRSELKLVRTRDGELDISEQVIDGIFFGDNYKQVYDQISERDDNGFLKFRTYPKYFPQTDSVLWIDPNQNRNFVCGLHWGKREQNNPADNRDSPSYVMAAKYGLSWSAENDDVNYCATHSPEYWTFKPIREVMPNEGESEGDEGIESKDLSYVHEGKLGMDIADMVDKNEIGREYTNGKLNEKGTGKVSVVVWLDKGDQLAVVDVVDRGTWKGKFSGGTYITHRASFTLEMEPFRTSEDWIKAKMDGTGMKDEQMKWESASDFTKDHIDLSKFLPLGTNVDDWLDHFCKAFNLDLQQPEPGKFSLDVKVNNAVASAASVVDLDSKTSILKRTNQALGLPSEFKLGFTINKEEEGYKKSSEQDPNNKSEDGGGSFQTGSIDGKVLSQTSKFSYNWFKPIDCDVLSGYDSQGQYLPEKIELWFPVITHFEIWERDEGNDYAKMMPKLYTNYGQRFWYKTGKQYNLGTPWYTKPEVAEGEEAPVADESDYLWLCELSNSYRGDYGALHLNYHDEANSIMHTYFGTVVTDDSNYTLVECYLSPDEYEQLGNMKLVQLNGDLYYVAAIEGYDPAGRNPTKLKLIRKI